MQCQVMGATGYGGVELVRLLKGCAPLGLCTGKGLREHVELFTKVRAGDVVFLATPAEVSLAAAPKLIAAGARVIDLSGAFRLSDVNMYASVYGFVHTQPALLGEATYGLTQLPYTPGRLVANPGCYATAAALAALPLGGLVGRELIVDAASGTSGAGRQATEAFSFTEVHGDHRAYRVLAHQHTPEIAQTLERAWGVRPWLTLTTKLLPIERGILATVYARLTKPMSSAALSEHFRAYYAAHPTIRIVASPNDVRIKDVAHTNDTVIGVASTDSDADPGRVVVCVAIDNLRKGAASQAVENYFRLRASSERMQ